MRVTVPRQRLRDGAPVRILVVDGYIENIKLDGVPERVRSVVAARAKELLGKTHVKIQEIERLLLVAGDAPGLRLKSALARGEKPGGALLVLEGEQRVVTGTVGSDNKLPNSLGVWQSNTSLALNSAFGFGEQAYVSFGSGFDMGRFGFPNSELRMIGGGVIVPVGVDGFTVNPEFTNSLTRPTPAPGAPASMGEFDRLALRGTLPVIRDRTQTLNVNGSIEYIEQELFAQAFGVDLNRDDYGVVRAGVNWQGQTPFGAPVVFNAQLSQGLGGRDGGDALKTGIPLSRSGASPTFAKFTVDARLNQPLWQGFRLDVFARAQTAFGQPLLLPEQFALDGADGLSAFPNGTFNVDTGATLRVELTYPLSFALAFGPASVSPYVFGAQGWGRYYQPTAVESGVVNAGAIGLGAHTAFDHKDGFAGATLGFEWARQFFDLPGRRDGYRVGLVAAFRY